MKIPTLDFQRKKNSEAVTEDLERQKPFSKEFYRYLAEIP